MLELASRNQADSMALEFSLFGKPWGFSLKEMAAEKVCIWHGGKDNGTTLAMGKSLADQIGCQLIEFPEHGHLLLFEIVQDVVAWFQGSHVYL